MSPIGALFWKEWRQIRWRLIFCIVIAFLLVYIGLKTRVMADGDIISISFALCAISMPLFIGMGLVAEEREQGCLSMQLGLPVAAWQVFAVKITLSILALAAPVLTMTAAALILAGNREIPYTHIIRTYGFAIPFEFVFLLWIIAFSMKRRTQWAAALTGIGIVIAWAFLMICEESFGSRLSSNHMILSWIITPFGFFDAGPGKGRWLVISIVQGIMSMILFWWGMKRFASLTRSGK